MRESIRCSIGRLDARDRTSGSAATGSDCVSVAVTSGKGGVGKTNIAVNLALWLAGAGRRVTLVDADFGVANADVLLGVSPPYTMMHWLTQNRPTEHVLVDGPGGIGFVAGGSGDDRLARMTPFERARLCHLFDTLRYGQDFVVTDCGAGISTNVIEFARRSDIALVVCTGEPTSLMDGYALIKTLAKRGYRGRVMSVVNMAEDRAAAQAVQGRLSSVCEKFLKLGVESGGFVLHDWHVERSVRARRPFMLDYPRCPASMCIASVGLRLARPAASEEESASLVSKLVALFG